jgi:hypothetical protein
MTDIQKSFTGHPCLCTACLQARDSEIARVRAEARASGIKETKKAFGGCTECYGKGYATVRYGKQGFEDFGGEGFIIAPTTHIHFCLCDRGKQLKVYFSEAHASGRAEFKEEAIKIGEQMRSRLMNRKTPEYPLRKMWCDILSDYQRRLRSLP